MISIGTLLAFATVCAGVVILRFESPDKQLNSGRLIENSNSSSVGSSNRSIRWFDYLNHSTVFWLAIFTLPSLGLCLALQSLDSISIAWPIIFLILSLGCVVRISQFPVDESNYPKFGQFACPFVPWLPCAGIFTNLYMIASLDVLSYLRIAVWTLIGFAIYFLYGFSHSRISHRPIAEVETWNSNNSSVNGSDQNSESNLLKFELEAENRSRATPEIDQIS